MQKIRVFIASHEILPLVSERNTTCGRAVFWAIELGFSHRTLQDSGPERPSAWPESRLKTQKGVLSSNGK